MGKTRFTKTKPKKGQGRTEHGEAKVNVNSSLTPTTKDNFDAAATAIGISRSELIERMGRKGEAWLVEEVGDEETTLPVHAQNRILKEYAEKFQRVVALDESSQVSVAVFVQPPKVWVYFNKAGQNSVTLGEPENKKDCLEITKTTSIWDFSNVHAYLDGCNVFAMMVEKGWELRKAPS